MGRRVFNDNPFSGYLDEVSLWTSALSASEIALIYNRQKQKYAGSYDSPAIDTGRSDAEWTSLSAVTSLPFMKFISSSTESASHYSALSSSLSTGLVGYWPFNESSIGRQDRSLTTQALLRMELRPVTLSYLQVF